MSYSFDEMFRNPLPRDAETVAGERAAALDELELVARGLMTPRGEQPEEAIHSLPGALRGDSLLSILDKETK